MQEKDSSMENQNDDFTDKLPTDNEDSRWVDNQGDEVEKVLDLIATLSLLTVEQL